MITIPIEVSARHAHLTATDWQKVFGATLIVSAHEISQPGQFLASVRLTLVGPTGQLENVGVVGPLRSYTQVEMSMTDARHLGLQPPLSDSGHLAEAATLSLIGPAGTVSVAAAIIQQRHIHASVGDAKKYGLVDRQIVSVVVSGDRGGVWHNVLVRVNPGYSWGMHVDTDEANAFGIGRETVGEINIT